MDKDIKSKYRIFLVGWYGHNAIGDDIIAEVIKNLFFEQASKRRISLDFVPFSVSKYFIIQLIYNKFYKSDIIVIVGGTILGFDSMKLYKKIKNTKGPLFIFGGGFRKESDNIPEDDRINMKYLFNRAILSGIRGNISQQLLISNNIVDNVEILGDPALSFNPISINEKSIFSPKLLFDNSNNQFKICMNVRLMKSKEPQYLKNEDIHAIFANLADYFVERGAQIFFLPFTKNQFDDDTEAAKEVIKLMKHKKNPILIPFSNNTLEMCSLIGKFDYIISQRLHVNILGWVQNIPNIAFDYQFSKTEDFMNSIGMEEFMIRTDEFSFDDYLEKYKIIEQNKSEIIEKSQKAIDLLKIKQQTFVENVLDIMISQRGD